MNQQENNTEKEFGLEDEKFYFNNEVKKSSSAIYILLMILLCCALYILQINWLNLNQYNKIKSEENYPVETVFKEQISYFGKEYDKFKNNSGINAILKGEELNKYWNNCVTSCEIPSSDRFYLISDKQSYINWVCNERLKENHYTATKYTIWKLNKEGCMLTNLEEVKKKDKEEISKLKWEKQKEMEIYLVLLLLIFLNMLHFIKKLIKNKK